LMGIVGFYRDIGWSHRNRYFFRRTRDYVTLFSLGFRRRAKFSLGLMGIIGFDRDSRGRFKDPGLDGWSRHIVNRSSRRRW